MSDTVISVERLSKRYSIGIAKERHGSLRDALKAKLKRGGSSAGKEIFWALNDVSFQVRQGDVLGVIGRNGAGKSTLLKILSRITEPTSGRAAIHGRVGSLLEVGTGFHPELSGRDNVYLNGAILGMKREDIDRKFDEIVAFSEVERFIDTPVKRYSSGMYVRLAFAVAAHLEPEVMIVDEVLAVGDTSFQKKCLGKMHDVAGQGRTILFVSHSMPAVMSLCNRGLMLEGGRVSITGDVREVVQHYLGGAEDLAAIPLAQRRDRQGSQRLTFTSFELRTVDGVPMPAACTGQDLVLAISYTSNQKNDLRNVEFSIPIHGEMDKNLFHLHSNIQGKEFATLPPTGVILCHIPRLPILPGRYSFNVFCSVGGEIADWIQNAGTFDVEPGDFFGSGKLPDAGWGQFVVDHDWSLEESMVYADR